MNSMWKIYTSVLMMLLCAMPLHAADALLSTQSQTTEEAMAYLGSLGLEELLDVEVSLDDTFDIFDGLIKRRLTNVASGIEQSVERAPAVNTVITAQDIEAMGATTIDDVLNTVPGFRVWREANNNPINIVRGISSNGNAAVLVHINDVRMNTAQLAAPIWMDYPISMIQRIEIIRGPGSALYGADAFAGVINIITKTAKDIDGTEVGLRLGNYETRDAWLLHGSQWNGFDIAVMTDVKDTDGHRRTIEADAQTVLDQTFGTQASLAPGAYNGEMTLYNLRLDVAKQNWHLHAGWHKGEDVGRGIGGAQALDPTHPYDEELFDIDLSYQNPFISENWGIDARINYWHSYYVSYFQLYPPGAIGGAYPIGMLGVPGIYETQTMFNLSTVYRGMKHHFIRAGIGYGYYDQYKNTELKNFGNNPFTGEPLSPLVLFDSSDTPAVFAPEVARDSWFGFIQDTWTINQQWELTTGIRYDKYSDFGSTTNPRVGLVWTPRVNLVTKLLYGRAFRAPAFQELYIENNPLTLGNPNLKPETIETWELAFDYRATDKLNLALNLYKYEIQDKIATVPISETELRYTNSEHLEGYGSEFELRWKTSSKSSLLFNYSYQHSEDDTGALLPHSPQNMAYLRADYLLGSLWYLDGQIHWIDDWPRSVDDPRPDMSGYTTVDVILRRKASHNSKTNLAFGIRNLFDEDTRYPSPSAVNIPTDIPTKGRFYFMEFRYKF